jgi:hypothetical protein
VVRFCATVGANWSTGTPCLPVYAPCVTEARKRLMRCCERSATFVVYCWTKWVVTNWLKVGS